MRKMYTVRLVVILDSGRQIVSPVGPPMEEHELRDYENRVKWGTMNTMEPFMTQDENGNQVCVRPEKIESTIVQRIGSSTVYEDKDHRDEAIKGQMSPITRPYGFPSAPTPQPKDEPAPKGAAAPKGPIGTPEPSSAASFGGTVSIPLNLSGVFRPRPPQPKEPEGIDGHNDETQEMDMRAQLGIPQGLNHEQVKNLHDRIQEAADERAGVLSDGRDLATRPYVRFSGENDGRAEPGTDPDVKAWENDGGRISERV